MRHETGTGTAEQRFAGRLELLEAENEPLQSDDEFVQRRQAVPWVRIDDAYRYGASERNALLSELERWALRWVSFFD